MKLSVIIPLRNEVQIVERNIQAIHSFFVASGVDFELIVVDDSDDGTYPILLDLQQRLAHLAVHQGGEKKGYGAAVRLGFQHAKGEVLLPLNGDLCDSLPDALLMHDQIQNGADIAVASRWSPGSSIVGVRPVKKWLSFFGNRLLCLLFRIPSTDVTNSFKAYHRRIPSTVAPKNDDFSFVIELFLGALKSGCSFRQIPTRYVERQEGISKMRLLQVAKTYLATAWRIFRKPSTTA